MKESNRNFLLFKVNTSAVYYNSLRAGLANGEMAFLTIEDDEDDPTYAQGEIEILRRGIDDPVQIRFRTPREGPIRLGPHVRDIDIYMPRARVEVGPSSEVALVAPVQHRMRRTRYRNRKPSGRSSPRR